ncbi:MAG TPA: thioredoxin [Beijerinckiaceae bacterium]|jgi:putative thioredoxin|nr:thioredoxin [Beijerinckiaceae bacterium]
MASLGGTQTAEALAGDKPAAPLVKETTTATFREDVLTDSLRQPVLVDFWAPWCGPCKQLTPVIEKVVKSAGGKVKLVKMNIDEHPQIAGQLGIKSIPAVIAFQRGQPIDGFMGALPESQVKQFVERLIGPLGAGDEEFAEAEAALKAGDVEAAADIYRALLEEDPAEPRALGGLAQALVALGEMEAARQLLDSAPAGNHTAISAARAALELAEQASNVGDLAGLEAALAKNPGDHQARFDLAVALNANGRRDEAANRLLEIIKADRNWNDDGARKQLVQFFEAWGPMDPATLAARRKLSTLLFS